MRACLVVRVCVGGRGVVTGGVVHYGEGCFGGGMRRLMRVFVYLPCVGNHVCWDVPVYHIRHIYAVMTPRLKGLGDGSLHLYVCVHVCAAPTVGICGVFRRI